MNKYNNLSKIIIAAMVLFIAPSCKKTFLDETLKTSQGNEFFKTDAGILQLAAGGYYQVFVGPTNGEWWYCQTQYGTDEFKVGGDPSNSPGITMMPRLQPAYPPMVIYKAPMCIGTICISVSGMQIC